jgi:chemotaxis signal transduction protein
MGRSWFAVPAGAITEILVRGPVTRIPFSPAHILGVCIFHGRVIPVIALEALAGGVEDGPTGDLLPRLVVLENTGVEIALSCEEATGVHYMEIPERGSERALTAGETTWKDKTVTLVDVDVLLDLALAHCRELAPGTADDSTVTASDNS